MQKIKNIAQWFRSHPKVAVPIGVFVMLTVVHGVVFMQTGGHSAVTLRSESIDGVSHTDIVESVGRQTKTVMLVAEKETLQKNIADIGVMLDEDSLNQQVAAAWHWSNYIPGWGTKQLLDSVDVKPSYIVDDSKLAEAAVHIAAELSLEPVDATLARGEGAVEVIPDEQGALYGSNAVYDVLYAAFTENPGTHEVMLAAEVVEPSVTAEKLEDVAQRYADIAAQELVVAVGEDKFTLPPEVVFGLLDIQSDAVLLDESKVLELAAEWSQEVAITPGITQVKYVDDVAVSSVAGAYGRRLNTDSVVTRLNEWLDDPSEALVSVETERIAPRVVETRTYTKTNLGLQKIIDTWSNEHAGTYRIAVRELGGQGREASVNAGSPTIMASTYKVFLSVVAYTLVENGELAATTKIDGGKNVEQCIEAGIVNSDNTCMVALGWHIGWDKVDSVLHDLGFRNMSLNNYNSNGSFNGDKVAPAEEQAKILMQLAGGSLISQAHTNSLLSYMKSQVYRNGIPAGSSGSVVANKVGFLYDYIHDMGIVYGPKSTYALVILSEDSGWSSIKDLSSEVFTFMNE